MFVRSKKQKCHSKNTVMFEFNDSHLASMQLLETVGPKLAIISERIA